MSKVYHGSIEEVKNPEIREPNRFSRLRLGLLHNDLI